MVIQTLRRLRQEDYHWFEASLEFQISLSYKGGPIPKILSKKRKEEKKKRKEEKKENPNLPLEKNGKP